MIGLLAVDGGQTAIRLRHSNDERVVELPPVGRHGPDAARTLAEAVVAGWRQTGAPPVERVALGLSSAPAGAGESNELCRLIGRGMGAAEVRLTDDAVTAHAGALSGRPGVSIVAGTGVACLALPAAHGPRIFGGHGYLLGDEGGGYWLGSRGIAAALRAIDGRGGSTSLTARAQQAFGRLEDLHVRVHDREHPVALIAGFALQVLAAADEGDIVATEIVASAARELCQLAGAAAAWVGGEEVDLALGGRLLGPGSHLRRRLETETLASTRPVLHPREPEGSPLDGAFRLGCAPDPGHYAPLVHVWRAGGDG